MEKIELLQKLWDEYSSLIVELGELTDDVAINEHPYDKIMALTGDSNEMAILRRALSAAGVKRIKGCP